MKWILIIIQKWRYEWLECLYELINNKCESLENVSVVVLFVCVYTLILQLFKIITTRYEVKIDHSLKPAISHNMPSLIYYWVASTPISIIFKPKPLSTVNYNWNTLFFTYILFLRVLHISNTHEASTRSIFLWYCTLIPINSKHNVHQFHNPQIIAFWAIYQISTLYWASKIDWINAMLTIGVPVPREFDYFCWSRYILKWIPYSQSRQSACF